MKRQKARKGIRIVFAFACIANFLAFSVQCQAQKIYLLGDKDCSPLDPIQTYYGLPSKLLIRTQRGNSAENYFPRSDSGAIKRINDSVYSLTPLIKDIWYGIQLVERGSNKIILSVKTKSTSQYLNITLFREYQSSNAAYSFQQLVLATVSIRLEPIACWAYASRFKILSYNITLLRAGQRVGFWRLKKNFIPVNIRQLIVKEARPQDILLIENIKVRGWDRQITKANDFQLVVLK